MYDVIERGERRVLTTAQIAQAYAAEAKTVTRNFQRNSKHFTEGVHYFALTGEELKRFKTERQNDVSLKYVSVLYLWTEEGAFLLAKSLNSDKAWQAYNLLLQDYYRVQRELKNQQAIVYDEERILELEHKVEQIQKQLALVTLHSGEQKRLQKAIGERVHEICNAKARRPAYFAAIYRALKNRYHVDSYRDVPQCQLQDALQFVANFEGGAHI